MPQYLVAGYLPDDFDPSQMDKALAWARKGVAATRGQVEVREVFFVPTPESGARGWTVWRVSSRRSGDLLRMSGVHETIETVWRIEFTRLIAAIARVVRDVSLAEELAQEALVTALEVWPEEGRRARGLADDDGEAARDRRVAPRPDARAEARGERPRAGVAAAAARRRPGSRAGRGDREAQAGGPRRRGTPPGAA